MGSSVGYIREPARKLNAAERREMERRARSKRKREKAKKEKLREIAKAKDFRKKK